MINAADRTNSAQSSTVNRRSIKTKQDNGRRIKFDFCPLCDRKGYYKMHRRYEHCRLCGMYRILLPGQDF